jgi:hypothetical protein
MASGGKGSDGLLVAKTLLGQQCPKTRSGAVEP